LNSGTVTYTQTVENNAGFAALQAIATGAEVNATNVQIKATNLAAQASALNVTFAVNGLNGGVVNLFGGEITGTGITANSRAYGINAELGGIVNANGVTIQTSGPNSHGVVAAGGTINLTNGSVTTSGQSAIGLQANGNAGPCVVTAQGTTIMTSGPNAFGATLDGANASTISLKDVTLNTTGPGASGLAILGNPPLNTANQFTLDHTVVNTSGDGIVWVAQSNANIDLKNGTTINPGSGTLLRVFPGIGSPTLNLNADGNVILNGNVNALARGNSIVNVNLLNNSILTGAIQNATNVSIESGSTWNITDTSTVTQNVSVNQGTLAFQSAAKFASTGKASVLNIGGDYLTHSTLSLGIGGTNGDQYDRLQVQGNASVNGTLNVSSLNNFHPVDGNVFAILKTGGSRSGQFAQVNDFLNNNPNLQRIDVYAPNGVALAYVPATTPLPTPTPPTPGATPAPTPNPRPPINIEDPRPLPPVDPDRPLLISFLLGVLDPTAEQLTALYEIGFSGANTQRFKLDERFAEIQRGSTGFVSNLPPAPVPVTGSSGKSVIEKQPVLQPAPENRWGVWANGWGDWVSVSDDGLAKGYDFTTGGFIIGVDYRITDHFAVGLTGGYAHTGATLQPSGDIDVNTGRGGLYATYFDHGFYFNAAAYGGYNSYDTSRQGLLGMANGSTSSGEFSTWGEAGYDFHFGDFTVGPLGALQYTVVHVDGFDEQGSLLPLHIHSDQQASLRTDLGARATYTARLGNVLVIPTVTAAWEHEYFYTALPITASFLAFPGQSATLFGPSEGHDSAIINAGAAFQLTPRLSTYIGYQGQLGRDHYNANAVTGGFSFSF
jgi:outer membrane autotransporter protein